MLTNYYKIVDVNGYLILVFDSSLTIPYAGNLFNLFHWFCAKEGIGTKTPLIFG